MKTLLTLVVYLALCGTSFGWECEELMPGEQPSGEIPVCPQECIDLIKGPGKGSDMDYEMFCRCATDNEVDLDGCRADCYIQDI